MPKSQMPWRWGGPADSRGDVPWPDPGQRRHALARGRPKKTSHRASADPSLCAGSGTLGRASLVHGRRQKTLDQLNVQFIINFFHRLRILIHSIFI